MTEGKRRKTREEKIGEREKRKGKRRYEQRKERDRRREKRKQRNNERHMTKGTLRAPCVGRRELKKRR